MTDLRFVLTRIGELSAKVDRLVTDVGDQNRKIGEIRDMIAFVRGAIWVIGGLMAAMVLGLGWYVTGHIRITLG